ncbi:MAG TPA: class D sortase [Vicinamibacterales bacterium]|nr:class D sortase [Vicinamibacterales bacterium]
MQNDQTSRRGNFVTRCLGSAERLLVAAGLAALTWCGVVVTDAFVAQRAARRSLETRAVVERPVPPERPAPAPAVLPAEPALTRGAAIGALSIPRVHLSAIVLHGSDAQTLRRGPGHVENTALPGQPGNVVIAGHRDSFFSPLRNIKVGDDIFFDTPDGRFHYQVTSLKVINPHEVGVMAPTRENVLTLITCFPFWVLGPAPDRFVVRASVAGGLHSTPTTDAISVNDVEPSAGFDGPPPADRSPTTARRPDDDQSLVRQAVERFRLSYNARLAAEGIPADEWLTFTTCDVAVSADTSTTTCVNGRSLSPEVRTFSLEHGSHGWAIKSVAVR